MFQHIKSCFILILIFSSQLWASAQLTEFNAYRQNNDIILEWVTASETNLKQFEIQRSTDQQNWQKIDTKAAAGTSSTEKYYNYIDYGLPKPSQSNYYYRLVLVNQDSSRAYSSIISVAGKSGIQHTWGSIKAMFR